MFIANKTNEFLFKYLVFNRVLLKSINNLVFIMKNNSNDSSNKTSNDSSNEFVVQLPKAPEDCCQTGCQNCVWIKYAEDLALYYRDGGIEAQKQIEESITDQNLKMFIKNELKNSNIIEEK
jgi:hypothetical protein